MSKSRRERREAARNDSRTARGSGQASRPSARTYWCILIAKLKNGGLQTLRFRSPIDPRTRHERFTVFALWQFGINTDDLDASGGETEPCTSIMVFDAEAECKAAYDSIVARIGSRSAPGFSPSIVGIN